ncbi:MAG: agmatinase, partial [Calditrichaeota bacterium]|nr:agmatinase [Calditrichota bacterium]
PYLDRDLNNLDYIDLGDIDVSHGSVETMIEQVSKRVEGMLKTDMKPILLGGEHTISLGAIMAMYRHYPDLTILQLDAHGDFRNEHQDESISHVTVIRRIVDEIPSDRIFRYGLRSGTRDEFLDSGIPLPLAFNGVSRDAGQVLNSIPKDAPVYVTLDMDVFDPSLVPGVSDPAPMGLTYREFVQLLRGLALHKVVGFDVVELAPEYDPTGVSAVMAASAVRDLMTCLME